jgi:hypothetical protein
MKDLLAKKNTNDELIINDDVDLSLQRERYDSNEFIKKQNSYKISRKDRTQKLLDIYRFFIYKQILFEENVTITVQDLLDYEDFGEQEEIEELLLELCARLCLNAELDDSYSPSPKGYEINGIRLFKNRDNRPER